MLVIILINSNHNRDSTDDILNPASCVECIVLSSPVSCRTATATCTAKRRRSCFDNHSNHSDTASHATITYLPRPRA